MNARVISGLFFLIIYLGFLAWYDGWGQGPLTKVEVEALVEKFALHGGGAGQGENLTRMGEEDDGQEFFMLNLNRYAYEEGEQGVPAAYQAYSQAVLPMLTRNAGHPIYLGQLPDYLVAGDIKQGTWHEIILVRYRSRRDFLEMVTSREYQDIHQHRAGGIDFAEVTPTTPGINLVTPRLVILMILAGLAWIVDRLITRINSKAD